RKIQPLRQCRRRDGDLEDILAQQPLDLLAIDGWKCPVVERYAQAEAVEDGAVRPEPFLPERDRGVEDRRIGLQQRAQSSTLVEVDDHIREWLDAPSLRAED